MNDVSPAFRRGLLVGKSSILLLAFSALAFSQNTGTLNGNVTDPSGAPVAKARVTAASVDRGLARVAETDASGAYVLPLLPPDEYTITVETRGFKKFTQQGVTVDAESNVRVDAHLEIGQVSETVAVAADAPQVDTRSSTQGAEVDRRTLTEMPLNGRNVIDLTQLLPGVADVSAPQTFTGDRSGPTFSTSGARTNQNAFQFDGTQFNALFRNTGLNFPPPDALQQVKVLTNQYSAEYGRNGGTILNVVTKSGTNTLHGSAWEFLRNNAFNATDYSNHKSNKLIQNQFGATVGGPILRNKLFFFASFEELRVRPTSLSSNVTKITGAEAGGDFSKTKGTVKDPRNGNKAFSGNIIPPSRLDPVAINTLKRIIPGTDIGNGLTVLTYAAVQNNGNYMGKLDYNLGRHTLDLRYNRNDSDDLNTSGDVPSYSIIKDIAHVNSIAAGDTWIISPNLISQLRIGYNQFGGSKDPVDRFDLNDLGGTYPKFGPVIPPTFNISSRFNLGNSSGADATLVNESREISDALTWVHDRHTFKFGGGFSNNRYLNRSWASSMGVFNFTGSQTGISAADFVMGLPESMSVQIPVLEQAARQVAFNWYAQDDWHIARNLTLNLGLRYELWFPWVHPNDYWGTFRYGVQSTVIPTAPAGTLYPGDPGVPRGIVSTDANNFAPRLGFAWDPAGNGKTAIRGGYGIVYEAINANVIQNNLQPFRYTFNFQLPNLDAPLRNVPALPLTVNRTNPLFVPPYSLFYPDPTMRNPYVQQFSLGIMQQVLRDLAVTASYVGKLGRKEPLGLTMNPGLPAPGASLANLDARRPFKGYGDIQDYSTQGNSEYNGLQLQVDKRYSRSFMVTGAYTFSRAIDTYSNISETASIPIVYDLHESWALSDFNSKHILSIGYSWDLPRLDSLHGVFGTAIKSIVGGWQTSGRFFARSGRPLDIRNGADVAFSGTPNQRPNVFGDPVLGTGRSRNDEIAEWFDPNVFALPANGTYGNLARNAVLGPPTSSTAASLNKFFSLPGREGMKLQFRSEFFNVLNHPTLSSVNTTMGTSLGKVTGFGSMRQIQLALKLLW
jgi:outer membrane receptor protein involved in Fe transport